MKKYLSFIILAILASGLTSCLKDDKINLPPGGSPPVVEFSTNLFGAPASDVNSPVSLYVKSYPISSNVTMEINVGYTGGSPAPQDITVNIDNDTTKIGAYNQYSDNAYIPLPAAVYTMPASVVIKKGQNFAKVTVTLKSDQFDLNESYVLPLHISSVSTGTVSGNYGTILVAVGAKNKYDGIYVATGTMVDLAVPENGGLYPATYYLQTQSLTRGALFDPNYYGTYIHLISPSGGISGYGSFSPVFTFDDAGNITSVVNYYGQPAPNGRSAVLDPTGVNKFTGTPGTAGSSFKVKYTLLQPGSTVKATFDETFTYQGPRP